MKKIRKFNQCLSFILILALLVQLLPVFATEDAAETAYGQTLTAEELLLTDTESLVAVDGASAEILFEDISLREENVKHFRMTDGSYKAVIYDTPVHYLDENGLWQEYDNTLHTVSRSGETTAYRVENGESVRLFAASTADGALLSVQKGDYALSLTPVSAVDSNQPAVLSASGEGSAEILAVAAPAEEALANDFYAQAQPENIYSALEYDSVLNGATLRYENYANRIKESIVIDAPQNEYVYTFQLQTVDLTPTLLDDGSIALCSADNVVIYTIPAPYMIDANDQVSYDAAYTLTATTDGWLLTVTADATWMNAAERAFPVLLDPTVVETAASDDDICATFVSSGAPNGVSGTETGLYAGNNGNGHQKTRTYVHINALPVLPVGCELTGAVFGLYQYAYEGSGSLDIGLYALTSAARNGTAINGLTATETWKSWADELTWNKANGSSAVHNSVAMDCMTTSSANSGSYVGWDITKLAFQWYDSDNDGEGGYYANYGFMLMPTAESSAASRVTFYGPKKTTNRPRVVVSYRNVRGIESDYTYQTASVGRAGVAYIGDFAMQNTLIVPLASAASDVMPFSVSLVYNSSMTGRYFSSSYDSIHTKNFNSMKIGIGWKLSIQETITTQTVGSTTYLVYTDGDGTEHYYIYSGTEGAYVEEDRNTRLTITGSSSTYTLSDEYGNKKIFTNGYLTEVTDAYGNALYYCYDGVEYSASSTAWKPTSGSAHKITSVWRVNKGGAAEKILVLGYSGEFLSTIIPKCDYDDADSKDAYRIYLTYETRDSGKYLSEIQFADGATVQYQYVASDAKYWRKNKLASAYDTEGNYGVAFDYSYSGKAKEVFEYILSDTTASDVESNREYGAKMHGYKRAHTLAVWRDYGKDQTANTSDDYLTYKVLNRIGQTVCAYTTDADEIHILGSSAAEYTSGTNRKNNNLLAASAYTAQPGINLLRNGDAEDNASYWSAVSISTEMVYSGSKSFILNNNAFYQLATLSSGKTYTFSAYVNLNTVEAGSVVQLALLSTAGEMLAASPALTTSTQGANGGWQRLSATYTVGDSDITVMASMLSSGLRGNAYVDCLQLEAEEAASTYNLAEEGSFENASSFPTASSSVFGWYKTGSVTLSSGSTHFGSKAVKVTGGSGAQRVSQQIPLNAPAGSTFLFSGWGKADALPGSVSEKSESDQAYFGLVARLYYADKTSDVFYFPFNAYNSNWQQVSGVLAPKEGNEDKAITSAILVAAYDNNINTAYFDNISLRQEPAQTYRYDENGNLITATQTDSGSESASYADNGVDLLSYTAANGTKYTYTYNDAHDVTSASAAGITGTSSYNAAGSITRTTLSGTDTSLAIISSASVTADLNHTATVTDANGYRTNYTYDDNSGLVTQVKDAKSHSTYYTYADGNLRAESVQQDELVRINYGYENGSLTSLTRGDYDTNAAAYIDTSTAQTYNFAYNRWGQPTRVSVGSQTLSSNTYYNYAGTAEGAGGNLKETTYGNGQILSYTYDDLDRMVRMTYTGGSYVAYTYNAEGQIAELSWGEGSGITGTCCFEYDSLGRLVRSSERDGAGALVQRTEHRYDAYNRLSSQSWGLGGTCYTESYTYNDGEDGDGSISQMTTATGDTIGYTYDALKRLEKTTTANANGTTLFTTAYAFRNISSVRTTPQIASRVVRLGESGTILEGKRYEYDALGNIIKISQSTSPYNVLVAYTYDAQNQLTSEVHYDGKGSATSNITFARYYTYDTAGNILTVSDGSTIIQHYTYSTGDWKDLLTAVNDSAISYDGSGNPLRYGNWSFAWQAGRQLFSAQTSTDTTDTTLTYSYDADGLRLTKTETKTVYETITEHSYTSTVVAPTCTASGYTLHECDCGDSYRDNITAALGHNYVLYSKDSEYIYQRCSRCGLTRKVPVTTDPVIPILPPIDPPVETVSLTASESDSCTRVVETTITEEHNYIYTGGRLMRESITTTRGSEAPTTQILDFIYDESGRPFALKYSTNGTSFTTYYYVLNLQGDVVGLINSSGSYVAKYTYDAWGNLLSVTNASGTAITSSTHIANRNPLRYRGYYYDSETGFYYLQSRYYDPVNRRFINADVLASTGQGFLGHNMFAYCLNNPANSSDSSGMAPEGEGATSNKGRATNPAAMIFGMAVAIGLCMAAVANSNLQPITKDTPIEEALAFKYRPIHSVYVLVDESGEIRYVGRTTNVSKRESVHRNTEGKQNLKFVVLFSGLNYYQARGLEQIFMIEAHTHKSLGGLNKINGIGIGNSDAERYMLEGIKYLENQVSNEVLNWIEMLGG